MWYHCNKVIMEVVMLKRDPLGGSKSNVAIFIKRESCDKSQEHTEGRYEENSAQ